MYYLAAAALLVAVSAEAQAHDYEVGDLTVTHPYAFATTPGVRSGAGYFTVTGAGAGADRLIEVRADFPAVGIHRSEVDAAGVARMTEVEFVEIPAGGSVTLEPGGYHVMFMGLTEPLEVGDRIRATLVFETAGEAPVEFAVEPRAGEGPQHADH